MVHSLLRSLLVGVLVLPLLLWTALGRDPVQEPDEAAWLFSTTFARTFFSEHDFDSRHWVNLDALDHPPVAKYIVGFFAALAAPLPTSLADKDFWHGFDLDMKRRQLFLQELARRVDEEQLQAARIGGALASAGAAATLCWLGELVVPGAGVAAGLLFGCHPLVTTWGAAALADPWFLLFSLLAIALLTRFVTGLSTPPAGLLVLALGAGASLGLAAGTKLTGLALWPLPVLAAALVVSRRRESALPASLAAIGALAAAGALFFGLNPALWSDPAGALAAMFRHRLERVELQQLLFEHDAIELPTARLWLALTDPVARWGWFQRDPFAAGSGLAAIIGGACGFALAALGGKSLLRKVEEHGDRGLLLFWLALALLFLALPAVAGYYLRWPRYLLPTLPLWVVAVGAGTVGVIEWLRPAKRPVGPSEEPRPGGRPSRLRWLGEGLARLVSCPWRGWTATATAVRLAALLGAGLAAWSPPARDEAPARQELRGATQQRVEREYDQLHSRTVTRLARQALGPGESTGRMVGAVERNRALKLARYAMQLDPGNKEAAALVLELGGQLPAAYSPGVHLEQPVGKE